VKSNPDACRHGHVLRALLALTLIAALWPATSAAERRSLTQRSHGVASEERGARSAAARLLAQLVLPPGARPGGSSADSNPPLHGPGMQPVNPHLLDLHGFWHLRRSPAAVIAWVETHPPDGASARHAGVARVAGVPALWYVDFTFHPARGRFAAEQLLITAARTRRGRTLVRADVQILWIPAGSGDGEELHDARRETRVPEHAHVVA
jgi:hypothetical protein